MSRGEEIWGHFYSADVNRDQGLDSDELQNYLNRNKTISGRHHVENDKMRLLCLKALTEEADKDDDNKMDFAEFRRIMGNRFTPSRKGKRSVKIKAMTYHTLSSCPSVQPAW